jgi:hypothetical protein
MGRFIVPTEADFSAPEFIASKSLFDLKPALILLFLLGPMMIDDLQANDVTKAPQQRITAG